MLNDRSFCLMEGGGLFISMSAMGELVRKNEGMREERQQRRCRLQPRGTHGGGARWRQRQPRRNRARALPALCCPRFEGGVGECLRNCGTTRGCEGGGTTRNGPKVLEMVACRADFGADTLSRTCWPSVASWLTDLAQPPVLPPFSLISRVAKPLRPAIARVDFDALNDRGEFRTA